MTITCLRVTNGVTCYNWPITVRSLEMGCEEAIMHDAASAEFLFLCRWFETLCLQ